MNPNNFGQFPFGDYQQFPPTSFNFPTDFSHMNSMPPIYDPMMQPHNFSDFHGNSSMPGMHLMPNHTDYNQTSPHNNINNDLNMMPQNDPFIMPNVAWENTDHQLNEDMLDLVNFIDMPEGEFYPGPISNVPNLDMHQNMFNDYPNLSESFSPFSSTASLCDHPSPSSVFTTDCLQIQKDINNNIDPSGTTSISSDDNSDLLSDLPTGVCEDDLQDLKIPDLNRKLKDIGLTRDEVNVVKKVRRQYKNRGYAHTCRQKKVEKKNTMKSQKQILESEIDDLKDDVETLKKERDLCKHNYELMTAQKKSQQHNNNLQ